MGRQLQILTCLISFPCSRHDTISAALTASKSLAPNAEAPTYARFAAAQSFNVQLDGNFQSGVWDYGANDWTTPQTAGMDVMSVNYTLEAGVWYCITIYDVDAGQWVSGAYLSKENWTGN